MQFLAKIVPNRPFVPNSRNDAYVWEILDPPLYLHTSCFWNLNSENMAHAFHTSNCDKMCIRNVYTIAANAHVNQAIPDKRFTNARIRRTFL